MYRKLEKHNKNYKIKQLEIFKIFFFLGIFSKLVYDKTSRLLFMSESMTNS